MANYSTKVREAGSRHKLLKQQIKDLKKKYNEADELYWDCLEAADIIQAVSQSMQERIHSQIGAVVGRCLSAVFEEPYTFDVRFDRKRGRTDAQLLLCRDGLELGNPLDSAGGGVIDVAAFALRVASLLLSKPAKRRVLILDEPFKFVHPPERRPRLVSMMEMLADEFDIQFIIVTGIEELKCGKIIDLG